MLNSVFVIGSGRASERRVALKQESRLPRPQPAYFARQPCISIASKYIKWSETGWSQKKCYHSSTSPKAVSFESKVQHELVHVLKLKALSEDIQGPMEITWKKQIGDQVRRGELVALLGKDSKLFPVESPMEGYLASIFVVDKIDRIGEDTPLAMITPEAKSVDTFSRVGYGAKMKEKDDEDDGIKLPEEHLEDWNSLEGIRHQLLQTPEFDPSALNTASRNPVPDWSVDIGDYVEKGALLGTIGANDKKVEIRAPCGGYVAKLVEATTPRQKELIRAGDPIGAIVFSKDDLMFIAGVRPSTELQPVNVVPTSKVMLLLGVIVSIMFLMK